MTTAPIALFAYNRPEHTRRTVEALMANALAADSDLFVFSDGPRDAGARDQVRAVRDYLATISGFRSVTVVERPGNLGLADSIVQGVTELCSRHGRAIVLEDDIVTSPWFLSYMNEALARYADDDRVMHVSGYMFPIRGDDLPETFFFRSTSCWGWATWQRAWSHFRRDIPALEAALAGKARKAFNLDGHLDFWTQVLANKSGQQRSWAVFWYASTFLRGGLALHPARSLTANIGHDDSGVHCASTDWYHVVPAPDPVAHFETDVREHPLALQRIKAFFDGLRERPLARMSRRLRGWWSRSATAGGARLLPGRKA